MCPSHVFIFKNNKIYSFWQTLSPSVLTTSINLLLAKFTPNIYFGSTTMHEQLFWKMLNINHYFEHSSNDVGIIWVKNRSNGFSIGKICKNINKGSNLNGKNSQKLFFRFFKLKLWTTYRQNDRIPFHSDYKYSKVSID